MAKDLWSGVLKGAAFGSLFGVGYGILETEGAFSDVSQREDTKYLVEWNFKRNLIIVDTASVVRLIDGSPENKLRVWLLTKGAEFGGCYVLILEHEIGRSTQASLSLP